MKLDISEHLMTLLSDVAIGALESDSDDALEIIATNAETRASFIDLCRELRETGAAELALIEFGPVKGELRKALSDPNDRSDWPTWNVLISADSPLGR